MKNNLVLILLLTPIILLAQTSVEKYEPSFQMPSLSGSGFVLNPSKLQMNHSVFFLGGVSSNNQGYYESTYTNHLQYKFNSKLKLNVDLNFVNFGTASFQDNWSIEGNNDNKSKVLPNFSLDYRPTENSRIIIQFNQYHRDRDYWDWRY